MTDAHDNGQGIPPPPPGTPPPPAAAPGIEVAPGPVPTAISIVQGPETPDGKPSVVLIIQTPVGTAIYYLAAQAAQVIGSTLAKTGRACATGLILPGGQTP